MMDHIKIAVWAASLLTAYMLGRRVGLIAGRSEARARLEGQAVMDRIDSDLGDGEVSAS
jgi:hypothetical protein